MWSGRRLTKIKQQRDLIIYGHKFGVVCQKSSSTKGKAAMGHRETETRQCAKVERDLLCWSGWWRVQGHIKNAKKSWNFQWKPLCFVSWRRWNVHPSSEKSTATQKTKHACIVEAHVSTKKRLEGILTKDHEHHIAEKGFNSLSHFNFVHKFVPTSQAMKIPDAKAAVDQEWKKLETISAWRLEKVKSKKEVILEAQRDKNKVHFATLMDICHLKKAEPKSHRVQRQSWVPWWHWKRRLWSLRSFHRTGLVCVPDDGRKSNWCHCKATPIVLDKQPTQCQLTPK